MLPSLAIDAGAILDYATEYPLGLLRIELHGSAATAQVQERHLRTVTCATT